MSTDMFPQGFIDYMIAEANREMLSKVRAIVAKWNDIPNDEIEMVAVDCMAELEELLK